jgi:hypothetical protein
VTPVQAPRRHDLSALYAGTCPRDTATRTGYPPPCAALGTFPNISGLPTDRRDDFLDRVAAVVDDHGGAVADRFLTAVYTAPRRNTATP